MWTELREDADVGGGLLPEDGGLPAQPAVIKEYGRFAYLEGKWRVSRKQDKKKKLLFFFNVATTFPTFLKTM